MDRLAEALWIVAMTDKLLDGLAALLDGHLGTWHGTFEEFARASRPSRLDRRAEPAGGNNPLVPSRKPPK